MKSKNESATMSTYSISLMHFIFCQRAIANVDIAALLRLSLHVRSDKRLSYKRRVLARALKSTKRGHGGW